MSALERFYTQLNDEKIRNRPYSSPIRPAGYIAYVKDDPGIVYKRAYCEWILPAAFQRYLSTRYNPKHVPVIIMVVNITREYFVMWEIGGTRREFDRVVLTTGAQNEVYYLRMSIDRIQRGYRARTPTQLPPSPSYR